jgi:osmotically-inducible protein OsmY
MKKWLILATAVQLGAAALIFEGCAGGGAHHPPSEQDKITSTRVLNALHHDAAYRFSMVDVVTTEGTAHLDGYVDTYEHKQRAAEIARRIEGVTNVVNHIVVRAHND